MSVIKTLLLTDVVDSTRLAEKLGDSAMAEIWAAHDRISRALLGPWRGREIDKTDGMLLLFDNCSDAVGYALEYHRALGTLPTPLASRAGLHVGPVILRENAAADVARGAKPLEVDGLAKPIAARVMALARGGQTLLTAGAKEALGAAAFSSKVEIRSHGHYRFKGIDEPLAIFELGVAAQCGFTPPSDGDKSYRVIRRGDLWQPVRDIPHYLPAEPDAFIGRAADLAMIGQHFGEGTRLLTLLGPGGTGKTRLATRYGHGSLGEWPGGIWFCDLSDASSLDGIHYATASTLGVRLGASDPATQLAEAIADRGPCLMVLDNFEQVVQHAPDTVGRWLQAPDAVFMVTSRERLHVPGEVVQLIEPLPLDGPAIDLFVARARAVRHNFAPDAAQRSVIADVVKLLDGLPLAIELAAARIAVLSPAELLVRLHDRFKLLAGRRGAIRQSTLRAAIDWSWQLLNAWEQGALEQCSVFDGGFALAAAEAVIDLSEWPEAPTAIDAIQALVDKSLLRRWAPGAALARHDIEEPYFGMYMSIHEYAAEKCGAHGNEYASAVRRRHGRYFATFGTDEALEALFIHGGMQRLHALRRELDNLLSACRRACARAEGKIAVACYRAAWEVLALQGPFGVAVALGDEVLAIPQLDLQLSIQAWLTQAEALTRVGASEGLEAKLEQALGRVRSIGDRKLEARILGRLGNICLWSGRLDEAYSYYAGALESACAISHRLLEARMHGNLAIAWHERGRPEEAVTEYQAALAIEREIGSERDEAITLCNLADLLAGQGHTDLARTTFAAALALLREIGDRDTEAITLQQLGEFELGQGLVDEALQTVRAGLALTRVIGNRRAQGYALRSLGGVLIERGEYDDARSAFEQALTIARAGSNRRIEANCLAGLGELALRQGRHGEAAVLLAGAERTLRELDDRPLLADLLCTRGLVDLARTDRAAAQAALSEAEQVAGAMNTGTASTLNRALDRLRAAIAG